MTKARIFKTNDGWCVERPAFGFRNIDRRTFPTYPAALSWLTKAPKETLGNMPEPLDKSYDQWPVVVR